MANLRWEHRQPPRDPGAIVDEQIRRWQLKREPASDRAPEAWPVVTISREVGIPALTLGRSLASRLGFGCWDRCIVTEIAHRLRITEEDVRVLDEHPHSAIDDFLGVTLSQEVMSADYGEQLRRLVDAIVERGGAVVVGRGSQYLVPPQQALRVRLVAPLAVRVQQAEQNGGLSFEEAMRVVRAGDRDRAHFLLQYCGRDGSDPADYDLVINTGIYTLERAETVVLAAYRAKFGQLPPPGSEDESPEAREPGLSA